MYMEALKIPALDMVICYLPPTQTLEPGILFKAESPCGTHFLFIPVHG